MICCSFNPSLTLILSLRSLDFIRKCYLHQFHHSFIINPLHLHSPRLSFCLLYFDLFINSLFILFIMILRLIQSMLTHLHLKTPRLFIVRFKHFLTYLNHNGRVWVTSTLQALPVLIIWFIFLLFLQLATFLCPQHLQPQPNRPNDLGYSQSLLIVIL